MDRSSADLTPGLRNPDKPNHWLVPPWNRNASYCTVVRHFLRWQPWDTGNARIMLAYFHGYRAALAQAPMYELTYSADWTWFEEMRICIDWCMAQYKEQHAKRNVDSLQEQNATVESTRIGRAVPRSLVREAS